MPHGSYAAGAGSTSPGHSAPPPIPVAPNSSSHPAPPSYPARSVGHFHPLPVIGHADAFYKKHIEQAEAAGDKHAKAAHKVGQHVTSALAPAMPWPEKLKRFNHCLEKYCIVPPDADESLRTFYHKLADLVRRHAGQEAQHAARKHHEDYHRRLKAGETRDLIEEEAEVYFFDLLGHTGGCPPWCSKEAWNQIVGWRNFWV